ncbi:MAG: PKD domain-containing protein [Bacteroidales bacterium]
MKRLLFILPILSLILTGCYKDPYADAIITPNPAYVGEEIYFDNISTDAEQFEWNMGDGTIYNGVHVSHYYNDPGIYLVSLKAFGKKGGVSTATFEVEVIGSQLKVIVEEYYDEYPVPNASVILYPTLNDWENETNPVDEQFTNAVGECMFTGLSYQRYYVDVWEEDHDNYTLASEDVGFIETQLLEPGYDHTFIAYVDYYEPTAKKSTSRSTQKELMMKEGETGKKRPLKENKFSEKKEK